MMEIRPGAALLYMKVGTHAQEGLSDILARKNKEIEEAGYAMWGYGGNTCHPTTKVQPFAKSADGPIYLCMQPMESRHFAEPLRAEEFSADGIRWNLIPSKINVVGSRYALCIEELTEVDESIDLGQMRVAIGSSKGQSGSQYVRGRVDKGCFEVAETVLGEPRPVHIGVTARLVPPYAVLLRS
jgi:hypothetical protein